MSEPRRYRRARLSAAALAVALSPVAALGALPELVPADAPRILRAVRDSGGRAVVVNVWATWCIPCREEMPDLLRLRRDYADRGVELLLVSADFEGEDRQAAEFLAKLGVGFPSFLKTGGDMEFIDGIHPGWSGALPATFVFDGTGELRHFREGKADYETIEAYVLDVLGVPSGTATQDHERREERR